MEKKNVKLGSGFKMGELMTKGHLTPDCSVCSVIQIKGSGLRLELESALENPRSIYIGFYDEAMKGCYAVCDGYIISKNIIAFNFDEKFVNMLSAAGISYYRMCVAVEYENEHSCFYVQSRNYVPTSDDVDYRGALCVSAQSGKTLAAYYSKGGRLSAKIVESNKFFNDFYRVEISALKKDAAGIELELICKSLDNQIVEPYLVSFNGKTNIPLTILRNAENTICAVLKFDDLENHDFTHYILKAKINGVSVDTKWSRGVRIDGCSLYEPISFVVNGENHSISCANAAKTFEFDYIEKYYSAVFSVIIAVYNTELFVAEAIESVLAQDTASIAKAIAGDKTTVYGSIYELILVDDGATDSSGEICDRYAEKYPQIKVIHKENGGVSSARNLGIEAAGGKYLNFLDSDDKFSGNVFKECFAFFEKNYDKVNIITFPIKFFDGATGGHWLNFKFSNGSRIIDYIKEYDKPLLFVNASFFKGDVVRNGIEFDEGLRTGEDVKFIYSIIFNSFPKIGVLDKCTYWYRRRTSGEESAVQLAKTTKDHYISKITNLLNWLIEYSETNIGTIPDYVKYLITQDLQWRFIEDGDAKLAKSVLNDEEFNEYKNSLIRLLQYVDFKNIMEQKKIWREQKMYMMRLKYQCEPQKYFMNDDIAYYYEGQLVSVASTCYIKLSFLEIKGGVLRIEGFNMSFEREQDFYVCINGEFIQQCRTDRNKDIYSLSEPIFFSFSFCFNYILDSEVSEYNVDFYEKIDGHFVRKTDIRYEKFARLSKTYSKSYFIDENWITRLENKSLKIRSIINFCDSSVNSLVNAMKYENEFIKEISQSNNFKISEVKDALELRKLIIPIKNFYKHTAKKKIWLVSDRVNIAGDNGEALFLYLSEIKDSDIDLYFVIDDQCADFERMKQYGKVVARNSNEYKALHLLADCIISSHADEYVIDPFYINNTTDVFRDIVFEPKYVFLQHGVIKDDLSDWLNRFKKNITGFITAAAPEYQSILNCEYYYTDKEVWLTGLPRHDRLYNDPKRYITIMPTWRRYLAQHTQDSQEVWDVIDSFTETTFFKFYNALINNERLLSAADKYNYTICFMPHPNLMGSMEKFTRNEKVTFFGFEKPYREIYAESDLMITDFSSSVMDFAYLRKPIVYCQFDSEEFYSGEHVYVEGYFDYETDGFGEVTYDLDSLVDTVIAYMKNGCKLKPVYRERADKFFAFNDKNNCERVYKKLKELN